MGFSPLTDYTSYDGGQHSSRGGASIRMAIIHAAAMTSLPGYLEMVATGSREVSSHYTAKGDTLVGIVDEIYRAWTSASYLDAEAGTIEIINTGGPDEGWYVDAPTLATVAAWLADFASRHGVPLDRDHVVGHRELLPRYGESYATVCPAGVDLDHLVTLARGYAGTIAPREDGLTVSDIKTLTAAIKDVRGQFQNLQTAPYRQVRDKQTGTIYAINPATGASMAIPSMAFRNLLVSYGWLSDDMLDVPTSMVNYLTTLARQLGTSPGDTAELQKLIDALDEKDTPAGPVPVSQPAPLTHTVKAGDSLWKIAGGNKNRMREILAKNPGLDPTRLTVGTTIKL